MSGEQLYVAWLAGELGPGRVPSEWDNLPTERKAGWELLAEDVNARVDQMNGGG